MHRQPIAQRRLGVAADAQQNIEPRRRHMPLGGQEPVAAARLGAVGKRTGEVDGATLAGGGGLDRPVLRVQPAHPRRRAAGAQRQPVADRDGAGRDRAGDDEPDPRQGEGAVDRHAKEAGGRRRGASGRGGAGILSQMRAERGDPGASAARHRKDRARAIASRSEQIGNLVGHRDGALGLDPVDLGHHPGDLGDPDQFEDVEVLDRLRARPVIGGDHQQHAIDRQDARQHVGQKSLMAGNVDKAEFGAVGQRRIGKAEINRQPAPLLLGQAVGVDPGQRLHQRGLAVIDMAGGGEDHAAGADRSASWARKAGSSSRQRRSSTTAPASIRPMTGIGRRRKVRARCSTAAPDLAAPTGRKASAALGSSDTGNAPLPIWLLASTRLMRATPANARSTAGSNRRPSASISPGGRDKQPQRRQ